jgi:hypothetical protein
MVDLEEGAARAQMRMLGGLRGYFKDSSGSATPAFHLRVAGLLAIPDSIVATGAPWYGLRGPFLRQKRFEAGGENLAIVLP